MECIDDGSRRLVLVNVLLIESDLTISYYIYAHIVCYSILDASKTQRIRKGSKHKHAYYLVTLMVSFW